MLFDHPIAAPRCSRPPCPSGTTSVATASSTARHTSAAGAALADATVLPAVRYGTIAAMGAAMAAHLALALALAPRPPALRRARAPPPLAPRKVRRRAPRGGS